MTNSLSLSVGDYIEFKNHTTDPEQFNIYVNFIDKGQITEIYDKQLKVKLIKSNIDNPDINELNNSDELIILYRLRVSSIYTKKTNKKTIDVTSYYQRTYVNGVRPVALTHYRQRVYDN